MVRHYDPRLLMLLLTYFFENSTKTTKNIREEKGQKQVKLAASQAATCSPTTVITTDQRLNTQRYKSKYLISCCTWKKNWCVMYQ